MMEVRIKALAVHFLMEQVLISLKFTTIKCQEILKATRKPILLPVAEAQASKMLNPIMKLHLFFGWIVVDLLLMMITLFQLHQ